MTCKSPNCDCGGLCHICDRPANPDSTYPLCRRCEMSARAGGKQLAAEREWEEDGRP